MCNFVAEFEYCATCHVCESSVETLNHLSLVDMYGMHYKLMHLPKVGLLLVSSNYNKDHDYPGKYQIQNILSTTLIIY